MSIKKIKDREVFLFNPITGQLDLALEFNTSRIVTCKRDSFGEVLREDDVFNNSSIENSHDIVTDRLGNVISGKFIDDIANDEWEERVAQDDYSDEVID
ncbi:MAG: hypothetical protein QXL01_00370 [Thermoplasmatales archaeon]